MSDEKDKIKSALKSQGEGIIGEQEAFQAAVLIPLVKIDDEWHLLFQVRSMQLKSQPGDVCFPGGKAESGDLTLEHTAVRETAEELGINRDNIEIIGSLDKYVPSQYFILHPYVGVLHTTTFDINPHEVNEVFTVPLDHLLKTEPSVFHVDFIPDPPKDFPYNKLALGEDYEWRKRSIEELFYDYETYSIWGMTAKILKHFLTSIKL